MVEWIKKRDWIERALKTFWQAYLGSLIAQLSLIDPTALKWDSAKTFFLSLICAIASAALSALRNIIAEYLDKKKKEN